VPKAYAVAGFVGFYFLLVVFNLGGQLLTNLAGFVIPGYYSLDALFTNERTDDTQWLTVSLRSHLRDFGRRSLVAREAVH
jgi:receptor expression-enhancing protein 5/6